MVDHKGPHKVHKDSSTGFSFTNFIALAVLALVAYQVYSGVALKKIGFPGMTFEFADKSAAAPPLAANAGSARMSVEPADKSTAPPPVASREFLVGHWEVEQNSGESSGNTSIEYFGDGTFSGKMTAFQGAKGVRVPASGQWQFEKLSTDTFRLRIWFSENNLKPWQGTFRIFDHDHIQNTDQNYVAVRVK